MFTIKMSSKVAFLAIFAAYLSIPGIVSYTYDDDIPPIVDNDATCECGVFPKTDPTEDSLPLLVQKPLTVSCDADGHTTCHELCTTIAKSTKKRDPAVMCVVLNNAFNLVPSTLSRVCGNGPWRYTGITGENPICCLNGDSVTC